MIQSYNQFSWNQLQAMNAKETMLILPISSLEQHGPQLPVGTDDFILQMVLDQLVNNAAVEDDFLLLPSIHYGMSPEHMNFTGTVTLSPATIIALVEDILKSVQHHGFQKVLIVNSHGGNTSFLHALSQTWKYNLGMEIYHLDFWGAGMFHRAADLLETPVSADVHGGEIETAMLLYSGQATATEEEIGKMQDHTNPIPKNRGSWTAAELSETGAIGGVSKGTAKTGKALLEFMVADVIQQLNTLKHQ